MNGLCRLTTIDNPFDPFERFSDWFLFDVGKGYNIGTFTAAGVNLQTSVDSIKGIANLAAVSGSTSQQASTAMYQLSQALAA